jgi:hypothetical protein
MRTRQSRHPLTPKRKLQSFLQAKTSVQLKNIQKIHPDKEAVLIVLKILMSED